MRDRINICKLPLKQTTNEGAYWAKVDGENIGINGRAFWDSRESAMLAAETFIATTGGGLTVKQYREQEGLSQAGFAELVNKHLEAELKPITQAHVQKWEAGSIPRKVYRVAIEKATKGRVKPSSFL